MVGVASVTQAWDPTPETKAVLTAQGCEGPEHCSRHGPASCWDEEPEAQMAPSSAAADWLCGLAQFLSPSL